MPIFWLIWKTFSCTFLNHIVVYLHAKINKKKPWSRFWETLDSSIITAVIPVGGPKSVHNDTNVEILTPGFRNFRVEKVSAPTLPHPTLFSSSKCEAINGLGELPHFFQNSSFHGKRIALWKPLLTLRTRFYIACSWHWDKLHMPLTCRLQVDVCADQLLSWWCTTGAKENSAQTQFMQSLMFSLQQ